MKWFGEKLCIRPIDFQKIKLNYKDGFYQIEFWSGKKIKIRQFRSIRQFAIKTLQKQYYSVDGVEWQNVQEWSTNLPNIIPILQHYDGILPWRKLVNDVIIIVRHSGYIMEVKVLDNFLGITLLVIFLVIYFNKLLYFTLTFVLDDKNLNLCN